MSDWVALRGEAAPSPVHLVGIGGAGMAALAALLLDCGCVVTGSDLEESMAIATLRQRGVRVDVPHRASLVAGARLVVYSAAVPADNVERMAAAQRGIPTVKRAELLGQLSTRRRTIAVAGTHGKTTTTAMTAWMLARAGKVPGWAVGGDVPDLGGSARWGTGPWFVVEADEFDRSFLCLCPEVGVINNVEPDHLDYYGTEAALHEAFAAFADRVPAEGLLVVGEDAAAQAASEAASCQVQTVGFGVSCDWQASDVEAQPTGTAFWAHAPNRDRVRCVLRLPGLHHVRNALAAMACAGWAGVPLTQAAAALAEFRGVARRFQLAGRAGGITVYEDYAHHPTEIRATLSAARQVQPALRGRLWAVFEPHTSSRTEALFDEFAGAFGAADRVLITDIYSPSGRERPSPGRGAAELAEAIMGPAACYAGARAAALESLVTAVQPGDCVVVMGAGPIYQLAYDLVGRLRGRD